MTAAEIFARLTSLVGDAVSGLVIENVRDPFCKVTPERWHDVALVLRYIWLRAGGGDDRAGLPAGGTRLLLLPRAGLPPMAAAGAHGP